MEEFSSINKEEESLKRGVAKDLAYFYTQYIPSGQSGNYYGIAKLPLSTEENAAIDFSQGDHLAQLESQPGLKRFDVLEAELKDRITNFYGSVQLHEQISELKGVPDGYVQDFDIEKGKMMQKTMDITLKEVNHSLIRGETARSAISAVHSILDKRSNILQNFLGSKGRQLNQSMILWQYHEKGYKKYIYITEGVNCEVCNALNGGIFSIEDAKTGVNLPPMHINCDCVIGVLNEDGSIAAVLENEGMDGTAPFKENELLEFIQAALKLAGLLPGIGKSAGIMNAVFYGLRGDYLHMALSIIGFPIFVFRDESKKLEELYISFESGVWEALVETVEGLLQVVTHPIKTAEGVLFLIEAMQYGSEQNKLFMQIADQAVRQYISDFKNGDSNQKAKMLGRVVGEIALTIVSTKGIDKGVKAIKASMQSGKFLELVGGAEKAAKGMGKYADDIAEGAGDISESAQKYIDKAVDAQNKYIDKGVDSMNNFVDNFTEGAGSKLKVIDGKVGGKVPVEDYTALRKSSVKNPDSTSITLGKFEDGGANSYIAKAGKDSSYFDMGNDFDKVMEKYDLSYDEMFDYFNKPVLDEVISSGKTIRFSHDP